MKKHRCNFIGIFGMDGIVFGDHVFLSEKGFNDEKLLKHEAAHVEQYRRYGFLGFLVRYVYCHFRFGYEKNPLEILARNA